jgi:hypothetical protein
MAPSSCWRSRSGPASRSRAAPGPAEADWGSTDPFRGSASRRVGSSLAAIAGAASRSAFSPTRTRPSVIGKADRASQPVRLPTRRATAYGSPSPANQRAFSSFRRANPAASPAASTAAAIPTVGRPSDPPAEAASIAADRLVLGGTSVAEGDAFSPSSRCWFPLSREDPWPLEDPRPREDPCPLEDPVLSPELSCPAEPPPSLPPPGALARWMPSPKSGWPPRELSRRLPLSPEACRRASSSGIAYSFPAGLSGSTKTPSSWAWAAAGGAMVAPSNSSVSAVRLTVLGAGARRRVGGIRRVASPGSEF